MRNANHTTTDALFPRVDVRLYRERVAETAGFSALEMDLLQLESGCAFIEAVLSVKPGIDTEYSRIAKEMMFESAMQFWPHWNFIFINKCMRLVHGWHTYTGVMETLADNGRENIIKHFMDLDKDEVSMGQFDTYLKQMTTPAQ